MNSKMNSKTRRIQVVCGVFRRQNHTQNHTQDHTQDHSLEIALFRKLKTKEFEFPGGKLEFGETDQTGLARELREELQIEVKVGAPILTRIVKHNDSLLCLSAYWVEPTKDRLDFDLSQFSDHDQVIWISESKLNEFLSPSMSPQIAALDKDIARVSFSVAVPK